MPDSQPSPPNPSNPRTAHSVWRGWLVIFLLALMVYAATANRGAQWQDSGNQILDIINGELLNPQGLVLSHPLHHWLGRLAVSLDMFEPCFAITLISALAAAIAVANVFGCVWTLTRSREAAVLSAVSLALAHTFWQLATRTECYTISAALLAGECWCLAGYATRRKTVYLWGMLLLNGLGVGNHMQASLTTPVLAFIVLHAAWTRQIGIKDTCLAGLAWIVGSLPYTGLVVTEIFHSGDMLGTLHSALFGQSFAGHVLNAMPSGRLLAVSAGFVCLNFPHLLLPLAVYGYTRGAAVGVPTVARRALLAGLIVHAGFVIRYPVVDHYTFFLPAYVLLSMFGGIGFAAIVQWERERPRRISLRAAAALLALTPVLYAIAPAVARQLDVLGGVARNKPYRDDYVYIFAPWSVVERSAEMMSRHAVRLAGKHGLIVVEDAMAEYAVRYRAKRDQRSDVGVVRDTVTDDIAAAASAGRTVVLVPHNADAPHTEPPLGAWRRDGDLYVLDVDPSNR